LVSGDYRSATDNLSLEVAEVILDVILSNSSCVPESVKSHAKAILRPLLWNLDHELEFSVSRGQMMGSYLSFPLLCIQNFLSFDFARSQAGLGSMPLLINGDDILFQSRDRAFPEGWMKVVKTLGLDVEVSKTSVSDEFGTLNSTLFEWSGDYLTVTPTLRFGMLRRADYVNSLGTTFHSFVRGQATEVAWRAARTFFSWHLAEMRSVRFKPDELGFRGSLAFRMSRIFGLLDRDLTVRELPKAPVPHLVVLDSEHVTMLETSSLSPELKQLNDREMASWKFSVDFGECRERAALRYCLQLSLVRRPVIDFSGPKWRTFTDDFSWRQVRRKRFFRPVDRSCKMTPVLDSVLQTQFTHHWDNPPTYQETVEREVEVLAPEKIRW
jgi:hypothetical protein